MLVEPDAQSCYKRLDTQSTEIIPSQAIVTIGPEDGWSNRELATAREEA
jgi:16S rRNA U1498 N3-methylase RsmE